MKPQSILFVLLLLQILLISAGCSSSDKASLPEPPSAALKETSVLTEETNAQKTSPLIEEAVEEAAPLMEEELSTEGIAPVVDVEGVFEGLEDNHTAIFSFDGAETAFYFDDPAVQNVLFEAALGSTYTLSYEYSDSLGFIIYEISE
jgi:hypothetical protein